MLYVGQAQLLLVLERLWSRNSRSSSNVLFAVSVHTKPEYWKFLNGTRSGYCRPKQRHCRPGRYYTGMLLTGTSV